MKLSAFVVSLAVAAGSLSWAGFAHAELCFNDTDCKTNGLACGTDICDWTKPSGGKYTCAPAVASNQGWCGHGGLTGTAADMTCKCFSAGATCVAPYCSFTTPSDGGSGAGTDAGAGSSGSSSGASGSSGSTGTAATGSTSGAATSGTATTGSATGGASGAAATGTTGTASTGSSASGATTTDGGAKTDAGGGDGGAKTDAGSGGGSSYVPQNNTEACTVGFARTPAWGLGALVIAGCLAVMRRRRRA